VSDDPAAENKLRELLHDPAWSLPPWPDAQARVRRTAWQQRRRAVGLRACTAAIAVAVIAVPLSFLGGAAPATRPPVAATGLHPAAAPGMPSTIQARPDPTVKVDGILQPGTPVPVADIDVQAGANRETIFGLASVDSHDGSLGSTYPVISTDAGHSWRIDGPVFSSGPAAGAAAVSAVGTISPGTVYDWGAFGNFVEVTMDAGRHWWVSTFGAGVCSVTLHDGLLQARAFGLQPGPGGELETFLYVSRNRGLTWTLQGRLGSNPRCGLPVRSGGWMVPGNGGSHAAEAGPDDDRGLLRHGRRGLVRRRHGAQYLDRCRGLGQLRGP